MNFEMIKKFLFFCSVILFCGCGNKSNRELQHIELGEFQNQIKNDSDYGNEGIVFIFI